MIDKVYVIFEGEYSDRGIVQVFADEAKARAYIYEFGPSGDYMDLETRELADDQVVFKEKSIEKAKKAVKLGYTFCLLEDGTLKWKSGYELVDLNMDSNSIKGYFDYYGRFVKAVVAKDSSKEEYDRCLKVARDAMAKAKAEKEGL